MDKSQSDENVVEKMTENFLFPLSDIMTNYFKLSTVCISVGQHPHTFSVQCGQNLYKVAFFVSQAILFDWFFEDTFTKIYVHISSNLWNIMIINMQLQKNLTQLCSSIDLVQWSLKWTDKWQIIYCLERLITYGFSPVCPLLPHR